MPKRKHAATKIQRSFRSRKKTRRYPDLPLGGNPSSKTVRLRYCEEIAIDANGSVISTHPFRANGMFDPNAHGVGHQPMGFDQQMSYYDHFTVIGSKCEMRYLPNGTNNQRPAYFGVALADDSTVLNGLNKNNLLETRLKTYPGVAGAVNLNWTQIRRMGFSAKKFFKKSAVVDDTGYRGSASADPVEQAFFIPWVYNIAGVDPSALNFLITIEYIAVLTEPKVITGS